MATAIDPAARLEALLATSEKRIQRAFVDIVATVKNEQSLTEIADLIERGRVQEAITQAGADLGGRLSNTTSKMFQISADGMNSFFIEAVQVNVDFDITNVRAVRFLRQEKLRLQGEVTRSMTRSVRQALVAGTEAGVNPIAQARNFRAAIGLTGKQEAAVRNFERMLRSGSAEALTRELRDKRFDRTVARAIAGDPLSEDQINLMTRRYRERYIKFRSETIARTEALRSVNAGSHEMIQQAGEAGKIDADQITRQWNTSLDGRERKSHRDTHEQIRGFGETFKTGAGFSLLFPGDPAAPGSETIQCRCVVSTRVKGLGSVGAKSPPPKPKKTPKPAPRAKPKPAPRPAPKTTQRAALTPSNDTWFRSRANTTVVEAVFVKRMAPDAPAVFKNWFKSTAPVDRVSGPGKRSAHYDPQKHAIRIPNSKTEATNVTWAHELGHAVDINGRDANSASNFSARLSSALLADFEDIPGIKVLSDKPNPVKARKFAVLDDSYSDELAAFDHAKASKKFTAEWPAGAVDEFDALKISAKAKLDFAADWEAGNWEQAIKGIKQPSTVAQLDLTFGRVKGTKTDIKRIERFTAMLDKLSDAIESASFYTRAGHANGLSGHGVKYASKFGIHPDRVRVATTIEYFANAYAAHTVEGWPLYAHLLELATPKSTAAFREIAEEFV